jgi:Rrf2 family protein
VKGGFSLAKQAREITPLDVLAAIEGRLAINICLADKKKCNFSKHCPTYFLWVNVQSKIVETLKKTTFEDLAKQKV